MKNIILIGFMGSGKSSVASLLSKKLKMEIFEMDKLILKKSKRKSINDIFKKDGEIKFRELEIRTAKKLSTEDGVIVSSGGGVVMNKIIIDYLRQNGVIIYLNASLVTIHTRLAGVEDRPLFKNKKTSQKLYELRKPLYEDYSDVAINVNGKTVERISTDIISKLKSYGWK